MKYRVVDFSNQLYLYDNDRSCLTFVYEGADPTHSLGLDPFFYVNTEEELDDKIDLLEHDRSTLEEACRL
jgi:hypothetical protein